MCEQTGEKKQFTFVSQKVFLAATAAAAAATATAVEIMRRTSAVPTQSNEILDATDHGCKSKEIIMPTSTRWNYFLMYLNYTTLEQVVQVAKEISLCLLSCFMFLKISTCAFFMKNAYLSRTAHSRAQVQHLIQNWHWIKCALNLILGGVYLMQKCKI